jgi:hypothetical protein
VLFEERQPLSNERPVALAFVNLIEKLETNQTLGVELLEPLFEVGLSLLSSACGMAVG